MNDINPIIAIGKESFSFGMAVVFLWFLNKWNNANQEAQDRRDMAFKEVLKELTVKFEHLTKAITSMEIRQSEHEHKSKEEVNF